MTKNGRGTDQVRIERTASSGTVIMTRTGRGIKPLSIISANVRGFQTNVGELTQSFIIPENPGIVACVETFLNENIPENFGKIKGYSRW